MFSINNENWSILLVSPNHPRLIRSDGTYAIGVCDNNFKTIYINDTLNHQYLKKVLCHELTHAAMFSYNIELNIEQEELLADLIATYGQEIIHITNLLFKRITEKGESD
jgi:uncharacterized protein YjaZ